MDWVRENWFWILVIVWFVWMHTTMHGGHGHGAQDRGHGGCGSGRPPVEPGSAGAGSTREPA